MKAANLHPALELRLKTLADRILKLKLTAGDAEEADKILMLGEILQLEKRYKVLEKQLENLNAQGSGFRQSVRAEFEARLDDIAASVEDFGIRLDRIFHVARYRHK